MAECMTSFSGGNDNNNLVQECVSQPGFAKIKNWNGAVALCKLQPWFVRKYVLPALKDAGSGDAERSRIAISVGLAPLINAVNLGYNEEQLDKMSTEALKLVAELKLSAQEYDAERVNHWLTLGSNPLERYYLIGRFPVGCGAGGFDLRINQVHKILFSHKLLPAWWSEDLTLYMQLLDRTQMWKYPQYYASMPLVSVDDAEKVVNKPFRDDLMTVLWEDALEPLCEKPYVREAHEFVNGATSMIFVVQGDQYFVPKSTYYQVIEPLKQVLLERGVKIVGYDKLGTCSQVYCNSDVSECFDCSPLKVKDLGACNEIDQVAEISFVHKVFRMVDRKCNCSDFYAITKVYPAFYAVLTTESDPELLKRKLQGLIEEKGW